MAARSSPYPTNSVGSIPITRSTRNVGFDDSLIPDNVQSLINSPQKTATGSFSASLITVYLSAERFYDHLDLFVFTRSVRADALLVVPSRFFPIQDQGRSLLWGHDHWNSPFNLRTLADLYSGASDGNREPDAQDGRDRGGVTL